MPRRPPGSGKTSLARELVERRGYALQFTAGREGLDYDTLMGLDREPLARSVVRTWTRYACRKTPVWFVFDEVNRARVEEKSIWMLVDKLDEDEAAVLRRALGGPDVLLESGAEELLSKLIESSLAALTPAEAA